MERQPLPSDLPAILCHNSKFFDSFNAFQDSGVSAELPETTASPDVGGQLHENEQRTARIVTAFALANEQNERPAAAEPPRPARALGVFKHAVHSLQTTGEMPAPIDIVPTTQERIKASPDNKDPLSTKSLFGPEASAHLGYINRIDEQAPRRTGFVTQLQEAAKHTKPNQHRLVRLPSPETEQPQTDGRLRKMAQWVTQKVLRRPESKKQDTEFVHLSTKADTIFNAIWKHMALEGDEADLAVKKEELRVVYDNYVDSLVQSFNLQNIRRDLADEQEKGTYKTPQIAKGLAKRYDISDREADQLVDSQIDLPPYSPIRLSSELLRIAKLGELRQKKRQLGAVALLTAGVGLGEGVTPEISRRLVDSPSWLVALSAVGVLSATILAKGLQWYKVEKLKGQVDETINTKVVEAMFSNSTELAPDQGRTINIVDEGKTAASTIVKDLFTTVFTRAATATTAGVTLALINPWAAASLFTLIGSYHVIRGRAAHYYARLSESMEAKNKMTSGLHNAVGLRDQLALSSNKEEAQLRAAHFLNDQQRIQSEFSASYVANFFYAKVLGGMTLAYYLPALVAWKTGASAGEIAATLTAAPAVVWGFEAIMNFFLSGGDQGKRLQQLDHEVLSLATKALPDSERVLPDSHEIKLRNTRVILPAESGKAGFDRQALNIKGKDQPDMVFKEGELYVLQGESGVGKTTFLRTVAGLQGHEGDVTIGGESVKKVQTNKLIAYVEQKPAFDNQRTFYDNLLIGQSDAYRKNPDTRSRLKKLLTDLGLDEYVASLDKTMRDGLSGGQQQRLAIIRALMKEDAKIILMDEPTSALDAKSRGFLYQTLRNYRKENKDTTFIIISHDENLTGNYEKSGEAEFVPIPKPKSYHEKRLDELRKKIAADASTEVLPGSV